MSSFSVPTIRVDKEDDLWGLPHVKIWPDRNWVKHVSCNGSRRHVYSYFLSIDNKVFVRCNEKSCITNAPESVQVEASKIAGVFNE